MESISERDCDLLLVEEFCASMDFVALFVAALPTRPALPPLSDAVHWEARHSVEREDGSGETDIEVRIEWTVEGRARTAVLLIENKIDANFQPDQPERYAAYAAQLAGSAADVYAATLLVAPQAYLDTSSAYFDARVPYEDLLAYFRHRTSTDPHEETRRRTHYRAQWLEQAIEKQRRGYTPVPDEQVTSFWKSYWELATEEFSSLKMADPGQKPKQSVWIRFLQSIPRPKDLGFVIFEHKLTNGRIEILIERMSDLPEPGWTALEALLEDPMFLRKAGNSLAVSIDVPPLDPEVPFDQQLSTVRSALIQAEGLRLWWTQNVSAVVAILSA